MSIDPLSTTISTEDNDQFGSQKGCSGYLGLSNCSLKILDEIQLLYEERMKTLDSEAAGDADRLRVMTLRSWVKDLGEQNGLLVRTVEELEREMTQRVLLLEKKFHTTSHETHKFMTRAEDLNNKLQEGRSSQEFGSSYSDSNYKLQYCREESSMLLETQVSHLKNDRENLCKLIQRGLETGNWNTKRFQFYEINDDDIFGPTINYSNTGSGPMAGNLRDSQDADVYRQSELLTLRQNQEAMERELDDRDRIIKDNLATMKSHIELKDEQIRDLKHNIQSIQENRQFKSSASVAVMTDDVICRSEHETEEAEIMRLDQTKDIVVLSRQLQDAEFRLEFAAREKDQMAEELASVHRELHYKMQEATALTQVIADMDKASMDKQAALTGEVADKHDQISALRRECLQLEEQCRQAAKQTTFKDGIIKEMRKEIKTSRAKILDLEESVQLSDPNRSKSHKRHSIDKPQHSTHLGINKDPSAFSKSCVGSRHEASKFLLATPAAYPPPTDCCPEHVGQKLSDTPERYRGNRSVSPPCKDGPTEGVGNNGKGKMAEKDKHIEYLEARLHGSSQPSQQLDQIFINKIEEKDKLIAYLEARISTLQVAALPSQEIDQLFFNKDVQNTASSVTFLANRTTNKTDQDEIAQFRELAEREYSEFVNVKKQMSLVLEREAMRENEMSQHGVLLNAVHGNLTDMQRMLIGFQQQCMDGALSGQHVRKEMAEKVQQLLSALAQYQEGMDASLAIINTSINSQNNTSLPKILADIEHFSVQVMEKRSVFDNIEAEIHSLLYSLKVQDEQSRDQESVIDELQNSLQLTQKQLNSAHKMFANDKMSLEQSRSTNKHYTGHALCEEPSSCCDDIDGYKTNFNLEQAASDEMKSEMNRLIATLQLRDKQIVVQEQTISELQRAIKLAQDDFQNMQGQAGSCSNNTNQLHEVLKENQKSVDLSGGDNAAKTVKRTRGVCFADAEIIEKPKVVEQDDYQAFKNAALQLKEMSQKLDAREEQIRQRDEVIDALKTHVLQVEQELKDLKKIFKSKSIPLSEESENQKRVGDLHRNTQDCRAEVHHRSSAIEREMRPAPKILRAASIEEFRVKTVEAQAALEDMVEETEALVRNLNLREDKLNILEGIISLLEQTLKSNEKEMIAFKERMDKEKQVNDLHLLERERQIKMIQKDFNALHYDINKSYDKLMSSNQKVDIAEYHTAAKVYHQTIDQITDKLINGMHFVISQEVQIAEKEDTLRNIKQYLDQLQNGMRDFKSEVIQYLEVKEISDKSRKESERKLEKWQCELEDAQDELRRNVEQYQSGNYVSGEAFAEQPRRTESTCRTSDARNYVYEGKDLGVRRAIERMKEHIDSLSDELEEQDQQNAECDRKLSNLKDQLNFARSQVETPQQKINNDVLVTSLREQQSIIDDYCRKSRELEDELARTSKDLRDAQHNLREKEQLLHNSSKRSKDEASIVQEQLEQPQTNPLVASQDLQKQIANQQITICNLQEALLSTKHQLEELQGKGSSDLSGVSSSAWTWPKNGFVAKRSVHDV